MFGCFESRSEILREVNDEKLKQQDRWNITYQSISYTQYFRNVQSDDFFVVVFVLSEFQLQLIKLKNARHLGTRILMFRLDII